ncbi:AGE family epimerase/isomerase [Neorhizobium sp. T25_13]|uniref:AGE family epimerase/isomerase n=1 Tax=Neorhizobium sp. T25_13 TaxID=2093830 RepID=UPI00155F2678|nr:AGE family epimerase/isomerase [Neorhizobium sp. T25_13]
MRVLGLIPDVPTGILSSAGDNPAATLRLRHWASNGLLLANNAVTPYGLFVEEFDLAGRALMVDLLHTRVQARMIYSFAHMALLLGEDRYADIALAAFAPWVERLWDEKEGGWFHAVTPEGSTAMMVSA